MRLFGIESSGMKAVALAGALVAPVLTAAVLPAAAEEVIITVEHVRALDKIDSVLAGQADFYAQVTIDGKTIKSKGIKRHDDISPGWVMAVPVSRRGNFPVKLEIYDHNVLKKPTLVDINRLPDKRDLDFNIVIEGPGRCTVKGFANDFPCHAVIKRAGDERRKAEVTFRVDVVK